MKRKSEWSKDVAGVKKFLKNLSKVVNILYKKARKAEKKMHSRTTLPVSIPINILRKESANKMTQTDVTFHEQLSVGQVERVSVPKVTYKDSSEQTINNALPKNDASLCNKAKKNKLLPLTMDASLKRKMPNKNPTDLNENIGEPKIVKETMKVPSVNPASGIVVLSNDKITIPTKFKDTKKNIEKSNEINVSINENPKTVEQHEIITINDKTTTIDDNIMNKIINSSENYKDFLNNFSLSAVKLYKSGKCNTKEDLNRLSRIINEIIMLFLDKDNTDNVQIKIGENSSENQSNDNNKNTEIEINLENIKQEEKIVDDDAGTAVVSEVVNRAEINTVPEEQIGVLRIERDQQNKQQPQQKINDKYNYLEQYNTYMMQNKNSYTFTKDIRPPCPPPTTPRLQQYQPYNNQNPYSNQESTNKNFRYPYKRNNRQTPYPRCPQQMNQAQIQQLSQNHPAYSQYAQYIHQQNPQMQTQMQGMYLQNTPYH